MGGREGQAFQGGGVKLVEPHSDLGIRPLIEQLVDELNRFRQGRPSLGKRTGRRHMEGLGSATFEADAGDQVGVFEESRRKPLYRIFPAPRCLKVQTGLRKADPVEDRYRTGRHLRREDQDYALWQEFSGKCEVTEKRQLPRSTAAFQSPSNSVRAKTLWPFCVSFL